MAIGRPANGRGFWVTWELLRDFALFLRVAAKTDWGCIHLNPSFVWKSLLRDMFLLGILVLSGRRNVLVFIHGWDPTVAYRVKGSAIMRKGIVALLNRTQRILVLASFVKRELIEMGVYSNRIIVGSTMFDGNLFEAADNRHGDECRLLFLSRFIREKGIYELLEAFQALSIRWPMLKLVMAGDGEERAEMEQWVDQHHLADRVSFCGYVRDEQKADAMTSADIFILPSFYGEGCPVALLEAMAAGLPVVTTAVGGIPEVVENGVNGILLDEPSPAAIEAAVEGLLRDSNRRLQMGACNREKAWTKYEADIVTRQIENLYHEVAGCA